MKKVITNTMGMIVASADMLGKVSGPIYIVLSTMMYLLTLPLVALQLAVIAANDKWGW